MGEFVRWFGGRWPARRSATHRYLPHASRASSPTAASGPTSSASSTTRAARLHLRSSTAGTSAPTPTALLRAGRRRHRHGREPAAAGDLARRGLAATTGYGSAMAATPSTGRSAAPAAETVIVPLELPFAHSHDAGSDTVRRVRAGGRPAAYSISARGLRRRRRQIVVKGATADVALLTRRRHRCSRSAPPTVGRIPLRHRSRDITVVSATNSTARLHLDAPLALDYAAAAAAVTRIDSSPAPVVTRTVTPATRGQWPAFVDDRKATSSPGPTSSHRPGGQRGGAPAAAGCAELEVEPARERHRPRRSRRGRARSRPTHDHQQPRPTPGTRQLVLQPGETAGLVARAATRARSGG